MANMPPGSFVRENPVTAVAAMGLTPTSQLIEEAGIVETPDVARIAKVPAPPRLTLAGPMATVEPYGKEAES